jgi:hypothetical protein
LKCCPFELRGKMREAADAGLSWEYRGLSLVLLLAQAMIMKFIIIMDSCVLR